MNTHFSLKIFGHARDMPRGIPPKIPGYPTPKMCFPWVSKNIPNFLAPYPFTWKTPTPREDIQTKKFGFGWFKCKFSEFLVAQPLDPPIALQGIATTIAPLFFRYRRVSHYTPPNLSHPKGEGSRGYRSSSCPLERIALYGGIAEIVSPVAVEWATK